MLKKMVPLKYFRHDFGIICNWSNIRSFEVCLSSKDLLWKLYVAFRNGRYIWNLLTMFTGVKGYQVHRK